VTLLVEPPAATPSLVALPSLPLVALSNENSAPVSQPSYSFYFEQTDHLHIADTTISAYAPFFSDSDSVVLSTALLGMKTRAKIAQGFIHAAYVVNQMRIASSSNKSSTPSRILHMSVPLMVRSYNQAPLVMDETDLILEQISKEEPIVYSSAVSASTDVSTDAPISTSVPASADVSTSTAVQASVAMSEEDMSGEGGQSLIPNVKVKASNSEFGLIPIDDVLGMRYVRSQKKTVVKLRIGSGNKKVSKEGGGPKAATKAVEVPSVPAADSSDTKDSPDRSKTSSSASPGPVGSREYLVRFVAGLPYNEVPGISRLFQIYEPKIDDRFDSGIFDDSDVPNPKRSKISVASTEAQIQPQNQSQTETATETPSSSLPVMATVEVLDGKSKSDLVSIAGAEIIPVPSAGGAPTGIMSRSTKHWGDVAGYLIQILRHRREQANKGVETKSTELALCTFPSSADKLKSDAEIDRITAALK
jgi:hypothetical protein